MRAIGRASAKRNRLIGAMVVGIVALLAVLAASATATTVKEGTLEAQIEAHFSPTKLPKTTPAPISLTVEGSLKTTDGSHPPVLKTLELEFSKYGHLDTTGLATCAPNKLTNTLTAQAKSICGKALIGSGRVGAQIAFAEQAPFNASGPLLIFNGPPQGGKQVLVFHVYAKVPAPTTFVTTALISKVSGVYGTKAEVKIPTIVGGQGSLTSFKAILPKKTWTYKGKQQSLLSASCPTGKLFAAGEFMFTNGIKFEGKVSKSCSPAG